MISKTSINEYLKDKEIGQKYFQLFQIVFYDEICVQHLLILLQAQH